MKNLLVVLSLIAFINGVQAENIAKQKDETMTNSNFTTKLVVDRTPEEVFKAVNNPRGWWSQNMEGETDQLGAVFYYHYKDVHRATFKITEFVPGQKVVWHVLHNDFNFIKDKTEWNGTDVVFEIAKKGDKTELRFTHVGLVPSYECYNVCEDAWSTYIKHSLYDLITKGKGDPTLKDQTDRSLQQTSLKNHPNAKQLGE